MHVPRDGRDELTANMDGKWTANVQVIVAYHWGSRPDWRYALKTSLRSFSRTEGMAGRFPLPTVVAPPPPWLAIPGVLPLTLLGTHQVSVTSYHTVQYLTQSLYNKLVVVKSKWPWPTHSADDYGSVGAADVFVHTSNVATHS